MTPDDITRMMAQSLTEGLSALRGRPVEVQDLQRTPFEGSSSFNTERLRAHVEGEWIDVFFKDLNPFHQLVDARNIRETALERSRRELHVYRNVLPEGFLGAPMMYGSRWEPAKGRLWLFLEDVGPKRLSRLGDLSLWVEAARWAAKFHACAKQLSADALSPLPRHDSTHYEGCADRLEDSLALFPAEARQKIRDAIGRYRSNLEPLKRLPHGLIHNEFFGKNVVIRPEPASQRIAVIDWETASIGLDYIDLICISAGRWTLEQRLQMWRGYFEQASLETGVTGDWRTFCDQLHGVALYQCLYWLDWWRHGDEVHIRRWLLELDRVLANYGHFGPAPGRETAIQGAAE